MSDAAIDDGPFRALVLRETDDGPAGALEQLTAGRQQAADEAFSDLNERAADLYTQQRQAAQELQEALEHPDNVITKGRGKFSADTFKTLPVNSTGVLAGTGDSSLDGEVRDAFDLIDRLAKSRRVQQSIIRHAFRFFMGRNERLSDSQPLIDAEKAYVQSGGSFKMVILSLLTSDSFMYRK